MTTTKPLYLIAQSNQRLTVELDGPALRIKQESRATGHYPLRQLARIYSSGCVEWSSEALNTIMQQGIDITFATPGQGVIGTLLPRRNRELGPDQQLIQLMESHNGWMRLENWLSGSHRRQLLRMERKLPYTLPDLRRERVKEVLQLRASEQLPEPEVNKLRELLQGIASSLILEQLQQAEITPLNLNTLHFNAINTTLDAQFGELIGWELEVLLYQLCKGIKRIAGREANVDENRNQKRILNWFHQRQPRLIREIEWLIERYLIWLNRAARHDPI